MMNMVARVSGGRHEMGASALRRDLNTRRVSSNEFISSSIACRRWFLDSIELVSMKMITRWCARASIAAFTFAASLMIFQGKIFTPLLSQ